MGKFIYDSMVKVDFEGRLLAHLQLVIGAKLRRGESFHFTWKDDTDGPTLRTTPVFALVPGEEPASDVVEFTLERG